MQPTPPKRELRAVWIATVANTDFPTKKNLHPFQQQEEFSKLLEKHQEIGINAVIVQVRPSTDAFYHSDRELWSEWLTGKQGSSPKPFYDPLAFMIEEAHKRGMEFHAWFNPYRAIYDTTARKQMIHNEHITNRKPEWFIQYGKNKYFNPAIPQVRQYITDIIADVVSRYPIDAVHFDDYFYPYPIAGIAFDDAQSFEKYKGNLTNISDWRRGNVNLLIESISNKIKEIKPKVKFGVSPFGIWRNQRDDVQGSQTTTGTTSYEHLYADIRLWLKNGWIDYVVPQVYFHHQFKPAPYPSLLNWWASNSFGRHLYIGQAAYKIGSKTDTLWQNFGEMPAQLRLNRQYKEVQGSVFFSSKSLTNKSLTIADSLKNDFYKYPALVPLMAWKDNLPPNAPTNLQVSKSYKSAYLTWQKPTRAKDGDEAAYYVIYRFLQDEQIDLSNPAKIVGIRREQGEFFIDKHVQEGCAYRYLVTAVDNLHNESQASKAVVILYPQSSWTDFLRVFMEIYLKKVKT
ncbi:MAG: glycoside hydrolase [Cytophagales bacterium]|nr:MAG: glycoside hydrolase [Cytophagales bacterium]